MLLNKVQLNMITMANYLHYYIEHPYVLEDSDHVYLGAEMENILPEVAKSLMYYKYPPVLPEVTVSTAMNAIESPAPETECMFVCTDVHLKDNPKLAEVWATESVHTTKPQESLSLSQTTSTVMPLLSLEVWPTSPQIEAVTQSWIVDTSAKDSSEPPGRKQLAHHCPVCQKPVSQVKSHVLQLHLPYYTSPGTACFHCEINYATTSSLSCHLQ